MDLATDKKSSLNFTRPKCEEVHVSRFFQEDGTGHCLVPTSQTSPGVPSSNHALGYEIMNPLKLRSSFEFSRMLPVITHQSTLDSCKVLLLQ